MIGIDGWLANITAAALLRYDRVAFNGRDFRIEFWVRGDDWTGAGFAGAVRASPDAGGAALATFSFAATLVDSDTRVIASLAAATISALPAPPTGEFITRLVYDIAALTPPGSTPDTTILAGRFDRIGKVA